MTIHILGLGESLDEFLERQALGEFDNDMTIGVNDIDRHFKEVDFVVCVDHPKAFIPDRLEAIKATRCGGFYSQLKEWSSIPNFKLITFQSGRGIVRNLDGDDFPYGTSSPYLAAVLAYRKGAKRIVFHGVDFRTHQNFTDHRKDKALREIKDLCQEIKKKGVEIFVGSSWSELSRFLPIFFDKTQSSPDQQGSLKD